MVCLVIARVQLVDPLSIQPQSKAHIILPSNVQIGAFYENENELKLIN